MRKKPETPINIRQRLDEIEAAASQLSESMVVFDEASHALENNLKEIEAMEPGIDGEIDVIERAGQEALAADAIEAGKELDGIVKEEDELKQADAREKAEDKALGFDE